MAEAQTIIVRQTGQMITDRAVRHQGRTIAQDEAHTEAVRAADIAPEATLIRRIIHIDHHQTAQTKAIIHIARHQIAQTTKKALRVIAVEIHEAVVAVDSEVAEAVRAVVAVVEEAADKKISL